MLGLTDERRDEEDEGEQQDGNCTWLWPGAGASLVASPAVQVMNVEPDLAQPHSGAAVGVNENRAFPSSMIALLDAARPTILALTKGQCMHALGMPRLDLTLVAWRVNLTPAQVAELLQVSNKTISRWSLADASARLNWAL